MPKKEKSKKAGGRIQKAIILNIPSASSPGEALAGLNEKLACGWKVVGQSCLCGSEKGSLTSLIVLEGKACLDKPAKPAKEEKKDKEVKKTKEEKKKKQP
jgi:hypothetical protein